MLVFPEFEQTSKPTTDPRTPGPAMASSVQRAQVPREPAGPHSFPEACPSHGCGHSLARGAVGDLVGQLVSLLLSVSAGSL